MNTFGSELLPFVVNPTIPQTTINRSLARETHANHVCLFGSVVCIFLEWHPPFGQYSFELAHLVVRQTYFVEKTSVFHGIASGNSCLVYY
jgi:hypothetical protein